jgi:hypothetical protein
VNWEAIGAIGEILGAAGVIITLGYLALQLRRSNKQARAATLQTTLDSEIALMSVLVENTGTWHRVVGGEPLGTEEETRTATILYNMVLTEGENRYHQFESGFLDIQSWEGRVASLRPILLLPIYEMWRQTPGALNHSADYLNFLEDLRQEGAGE